MPRAAAWLSPLLLLATSTFASGETGAEGWLRYSPLNPSAAMSYRSLPHHVIQAGTSLVAQSAASELTRGLHSMLGFELDRASTLPEDDAFVLGTPAEIQICFRLGRSLDHSLRRASLSPTCLQRATSFG